MNEFFKDTDRIIHDLIQKYPSIQLTSSPDPFFSLVESIISQQLSVKAADTIVKRFLTLFEDGKVTPQAIVSTPLQQMRNVGMSWSKAQYVTNIAQAVCDGSLNFQNIATLSDEEVIRELTKIKGIGRWTAEMFLMFTLGRPDVMSFGDVGLQNAIQKLYQLTEKPTKQQMETISNKWKPYRTYACKLLWKSLDNQ